MPDLSRGGEMEQLEHHAASSEGRAPRGRREEASSVSVAIPRLETADQYSGGMLSRCLHDRTVWMETPQASAINSAGFDRAIFE